MGADEHDGPAGRGGAAARTEQSAAAQTVLRLEMHVSLRTSGAWTGGRDRLPPSENRQSGPGRTGAEPRSRGRHVADLTADRLTIEDDTLFVWHEGTTVFACPVADLVAVTFPGAGTGFPGTGAAAPGTSDPAERPREGRGTHDPREQRYSPGGRGGHDPRYAAELTDRDHRDLRRAAHRDLSSANTRWTAEDERRLLELHAAGTPLDAIARALGRQKGAVRVRLHRLRGRS